VGEVDYHPINEDHQELTIAATNEDVIHVCASSYIWILTAQ
jgi:hypothetical protein